MIDVHSYLPLDAAKKHHEYLVRLEKEELPEAKAARLKASRVKQQRIRVSDHAWVMITIYPFFTSLVSVNFFFKLSDVSVSITLTLISGKYTSKDVQAIW